MQRIYQDFNADKVFTTQIPMDVNVAKAVDSFMPVVLSNPHSSGAKSFTQLTQEFLQKLNASVTNKVQTANQNLVRVS
jgi:chromosome partitioning protein